MPVVRELFQKYSLGLLFTAALFLFWQGLLTKPSVMNRTDYLAPPLEIKYLTAGFSTAASDSFWMRAVQDMDFCDQEVKARECRGKSWLFQVINLTVELDRGFKEAYYYGGLALTVLISDYEGASVIFDKGIESFQDDWHLYYAAAYHALFEEKNKLKASGLYLKAAELGAPGWVQMMAGRLAAEGGDRLKATEVLNQMIETEKDPAWIEKLRKKIQESK